VATVYSWHAAPVTSIAANNAVPEGVRPSDSARFLAEQPSAEEPDWTREQCSALEWRPARQLLRAVRDYKRARERGGIVGSVQRRAATLRHRFWSAVAGADIPVNSARIAGGLMIPHPNGVVVHPEAVIGPNCILFQQVTIGTGPKPGVPRLGGHVDVGPGAKILGGVTIGDHAVIGANAVVLNDVPAGAVAVGVPAVTKRVLPMRHRESA
jgi:serine O-acetyltransferase